MAARVMDNAADKSVTRLILLQDIYFGSAVEVSFPYSNILLLAK